MKSLFQGQLDLVLNIPSTMRDRWCSSSTTRPTPASLAKDILEEFGIRRIASKKVFQVFSIGVMDICILTRFGGPILKIKVLLIASCCLVSLVLISQFIILLTLFFI